jgi:hypothetical protein
MILSHKYKFIFIRNGKTGTTSIENILKDFDESQDMNQGLRGLWVNGHIPPAVLKSFLPSDIWNQYFKFVFVRHPLDWFVSQYRYNFTAPVAFKPEMLMKPKRLLSVIRNYKQSKELYKKQVFNADDVDFIFQYLRKFRGLPCSPSLMQSSYVYDVDGNILVDFIGRFENLVSDVEQIKAKIGIDFELPHLNKSKNRKPYQSCLTNEAVNRIKTLWDIDFRNFGYQVAESELALGE